MRWLLLGATRIVSRAVSWWQWTVLKYLPGAAPYGDPWLAVIPEGWVGVWRCHPRHKYSMSAVPPSIRLQDAITTCQPRFPLTSASPILVALSSSYASAFLPLLSARVHGVVPCGLDGLGKTNRQEAHSGSSTRSGG